MLIHESYPDLAPMQFLLGGKYTLPTKGITKPKENCIGALLNLKVPWDAVTVNSALFAFAARAEGKCRWDVGDVTESKSVHVRRYMGIGLNSL